MSIEHIAIWVHNLEESRHFYTNYFKMKSSDKYENREKEFSSYFLSFEKGGTRIELMHKPSISEFENEKGIVNGFAHFAISVGNKQKVDMLTEQLRSDGYEIVGEPRITGDGYYESIVLDPEGNPVEITE